MNREGTVTNARHSTVDADAVDLVIGTNWNRHDVAALQLYFRGISGNTGSFTALGGGQYEITGSGFDIWNVTSYSWGEPGAVNHDEFHFAYMTSDTPMHSLSLKVESLELLSGTGLNGWAKVGAMMRDTLNESSSHASAVITPGQGRSNQWRGDPEAGSNSTTDAGFTAPIWLKIERDITGACLASSSADGTNWEAIAGPNLVTMAAPYYFGVAITSHDRPDVVRAVVSDIRFDNAPVTLTNNQDVGIYTNSTEPLYVELSDNFGQSKAIVHPDAQAVNSGAYQEWNIALNEFTNVYMNSISKMKIGVGVPGGPVGDTGWIYVDSIRLLKPRFIAGMLPAWPEDLVYDGVIDILDAGTLFDYWLAADVAADINGDGIVNFKDFAIVTDKWLEVQLWPEP